MSKGVKGIFALLFPKVDLAQPFLKVEKGCFSSA